MQEKRVVSEADYRCALAEIRRLAESEPDRGTLEGDRLEVLAAAVEAYESNFHLRESEDAENR